MSARVRRNGPLEILGVTTEHDVIWRIGTSDVFETNGAYVLSRTVADDGLARIWQEYVNESDLIALRDALKARNAGEGYPLCLSCHRASVVLGLDVCSGCNDGAELRDWPRRVEPDSAFVDLDPNTDEHGNVHTPGQWPIGGAL